MDPTTQALLFALLGAVLGGGVVLAWRVSEQQQSRVPDHEEPVLPAGVATVLGVLRSSALVVDEHDEVLKASAPTYSLGLVRGNLVVVDELADLVRTVRRDGQIREAELVLRDLGRPPVHLVARVAPLSSRLVLALLDDRTREKQVEEIRRDFVANVSHELKTPVGALNLLAEAVAEAADDPEAVRRFAGRMRTEGDRLTRLVQQIIELSRLQGDAPLEAPRPVHLPEVIAQAVDASSIDAGAKQISVHTECPPDLELLGSSEQITLALSNLVSNAVTYSPEGSTVLVAARPGDTTVDLTVTDQGIGIPAGEIDRIFERFYRVDPARHRSTGGTGLGLSIVKHVAASHGGEVRVWSVPDEGSSFTLSLPRRPPSSYSSATQPTAEAEAHPAPTPAPTEQEARP